MKQLLLILFIIPIVTNAQLVTTIKYKTFLYKKPYAKLQPGPDDIYEAIEEGEHIVAVGKESNMLIAVFNKRIGYIPSDYTEISQTEKNKLSATVVDSAKMLSQASEYLASIKQEQELQAAEFAVLKQKRSEEIKRLEKKYEGLGILRLGYTKIADLNEIFAETVKKPKLQSGLDLRFPGIEHLPLVKRYEVESYNLSPFIVYNMELSFCRDTLFEIKINNPGTEFIDAVEIKYGKPKTNISKKKVVCQNGYGATFKYEEIDITQQWKSKMPNTSIYNIYSKYYGDKCKENRLSVLSITNEKIVAEIEAFAEKAQRKEDKKQKDRLKSELKDF